MKYVPLILGNLLRKKTRTILTVASFFVALFLFGLLVAIRGGFNQGIDVAGADRLVVLNRVSLIQPLKRTYLERLLRIEGVADATYASWFGGIYQDRKNFFAQFAIEAESFHRVYPEYLIASDEWKAFLADRAGCIVGEATAKRFGWKVGDRIPLQGTIFLGTWEFNLRGIYKGARKNDDTTQFWMNADYLEEKGPNWWKGFVGWYVVKIKDPAQATKVSAAIDQAFANSPFETRTQSEKSFATSFVQAMGNIEFLILVIGSVVFFTLLLVSANTMGVAVRERIPELAIMKAVGFSDRFVLFLVLIESTLVAVLGGGLGLLLARLAFSSGDILVKGFIILYLPPAAIGLGLLLAVAVGVAAALAPALRAMNLNVIDALRRV